MAQAFTRTSCICTAAEKALLASSDLEEEQKKVMSVRKWRTNYIFPALEGNSIGVNGIWQVKLAVKIRR